MTAVLSLLVVASPGFAQGIVLDWTAPAECPSGADVQFRVDSLLHGKLPAQPVAVQARVERAARGYHLRLSLAGGAYHARRNVVANSCDDLLVTASWLIAVAIDPEVAASPAADPTTEPTTAPTAPAEVQASTAPTDEAKTQSRRSEAQGSTPGNKKPPPAVKNAPPEPTPHLSAAAKWLSGGPFVGAGSLGLPGAQWLMGGAVGLGLGVLYLEADLAGYMPSERHVDPRAEVRLWSLESGLSACALSRGRWRAGACAGLAGLRSHGSAEYVTAAHDQTLYWARARFELRASLRAAEWLELGVVAGLGVPVTARPGFEVSGLGTVVEAARLQGYGRLGLSFRTR